MQPDAESERRIFFDVSDLIVFLLANTRPTGIQRVELSAMAEVAKSSARRNIHFGFFIHRKNRMMTISTAHLAILTDALRDAAVSQNRVRLLVSKIVLGARSMPLAPSDTYVIFGAFWISRYYLRALSGLKQRGITVGAFIHDLIPLTHPQFIRPAKLEGMQAFYLRTLALIDFACCNSKYVAGEVAKLLDERLHRSVPIAAAPLAHDADGLKEGVAADAKPLPQVPTDYALCVGSLDGRKNHLLLVSVWSALNRKYEGRVPALVFAGKWWRNSDALRQMLEQTNRVDGKIILLEDVSDAQLAQLYENCLLTLFPSFAEGWGLPVGESLSFGKPCIASHTSSIPEVGGDLVRYIDPHDPEAATVVIEQALMDRPGLAAWTDRIQQDFKPRSWKTATDDLLAKVAECAASAGANREGRS
ncbi:glycosyltransferase family 1 protein [Roseiarcaceae bacterium H3SJ34-1]|uniref:glycosyltransferase family 4 protein n=1 Tax=Terripilifer ovatus TaxID=3032367 RepID=UPI003AB942EA|nr:glycosyltransferase family 1 protein [Roseiarcaceae bacterium H3SJ34-1]